jgi:RNA polymerase sigma-70 factor, ECF subfamily
MVRAEPPSTGVGRCRVPVGRAGSRSGRDELDAELEGERRLEALFADHADEVLTYLRHRTDQETAQEVLTETFVVAWRKLPRVPPEPRGWLYAVARRVLANHIRSQGRTAALMERLIAEYRMPPDGGDVREAESRHDMLTLLATLPEQDREVLLLAGWYELSGPEAAQALGCSRAAYAVRLHRARRRLRTALALTADDGDDTAASMTVQPAWENR